MTPAEPVRGLSSFTHMGQRGTRSVGSLPARAKAHHYFRSDRHGASPEVSTVLLTRTFIARYGLLVALAVAEVHLADDR